MRSLEPVTVLPTLLAPTVNFVCKGHAVTIPSLAVRTVAARGLVWRVVILHAILAQDSVTVNRPILERSATSVQLVIMTTRCARNVTHVIPEELIAGYVIAMMEHAFVR